MTLADYAPGSGFSGTIPLEGGVAYNVPTFIPNPAAINAGGNGFVTTNVPGFYTDYHGIEFSVNKRLSNRWMGRVGVALNNAREHFDEAAGMIDTNGNPTPTVTEPLQTAASSRRRAAAAAPARSTSTPSGSSTPTRSIRRSTGIELSANVFGRQGYPFPIVRTGTAAALGADSALTVLLSPEIDTFRFPNLWNTDFRVAQAVPPRAASNIRLMLDVFNVFNANTALVRVNDITSTTVQRAGAEPEPADRARRRGHRVLKGPWVEAMGHGGIGHGTASS